MVLSYYIYKFPYKLFWYFKNLLKKNTSICFYCADPLDYDMFKPILKYLPEVKVIAKNSKTRNYLKKLNINYINMPSFPKVVIMARHMPYKFPVDKIKKIGFDHGLYQFKRWTSPKNYNDFDIYFVSSESQVETAKNMGITSVKAIGYPKLDRAFNGEINNKYLSELMDARGIDRSKKTILFTTTWDIANLSMISKWINTLPSLSNKYNILVTVHTWTKDKFKQQLRTMDNVIYLEEMDITPFLMIADVLIGDYSSIIGEFCALNKPIITFKVPSSERTIPEIQNMIADISIQINNVEELAETIHYSLLHPEEKSENRIKANNIMYYALDGEAGRRGAEIIYNYL